MITADFPDRDPAAEPTTVGLLDLGSVTAVLATAATEIRMSVLGPGR